MTSSGSSSSYLVALFLATCALIVLVWAWLGYPVAMPASPVAPGARLSCVSYAPFRGDQSPLVDTAPYRVEDIDDDLARLAKLTDCVRTYASLGHGNDRIAEIAQKRGLKILQGIWLGRTAADNARQIEKAIEISQTYPDTVKALIVGNEVLLRGEMSADDLAATVRAVNARTVIPVTYADVWDFWLHAPAVAEAADFITIHILPFWEDLPIPADAAARHVGAIYRKMTAAFPGRELMIGEVGWPSAGRMREGALPSPSNQARVIHDVLALAKADRIGINVIESFDQPWKRKLEGTVGGHWGFLDAHTREFKFHWGEPVSDHPDWVRQAGLGVAFAAAVFAIGFAGARTTGGLTPNALAGLALLAGVGGLLVGWTLENMTREALGWVGWTRSIGLAVLAVGCPLASAAAVSRGRMPTLANLLNPGQVRTSDPAVLALGALLIPAILIVTEVALGLVFDPRYRDLPFAPMSAIAAAYAVKSLVDGQNRSAARSRAEFAAGCLLALATVYILFHEGLNNWQSVWLCVAFAAFAWALTRVRAAPG